MTKTMRTRARCGRAALGALIAASALASAAMPASAGGPAPGTTAVDIIGTDSDPSNGLVLVYGRVSAAPGKCAANRPVTLEFDRGSGFKSVDEDRTSRRGYFITAASLGSTPQRVRVVALRSTIRVGDKKLTCKRAVGEIPV